jgi:hypothetical protein
MSRKQSAKNSDLFDEPVSILQTKRAIFWFSAAKGSREIKPAVSGMSRTAGKERIRWKIYIYGFSQRGREGCIGVKTVSLFLTRR